MPVYEDEVRCKSKVVVKYIIYYHELFIHYLPNAEYPMPPTERFIITLLYTVCQWYEVGCKSKVVVKYNIYYHLSTTFPMLNIPCLQPRDSSSHWFIRHLPTITLPKCCNRPSKNQVPSKLPTSFYRYVRRKKRERFGFLNFLDKNLK